MRLSYVSICLLMTTSLVARNADSADAWPQFLGPRGDGVVSQSADPPTSWSPTQNVAWRTELPGKGWSSPVVGGGRIYVTAAIPAAGEAYDLCLLVIDERSGELLDKFVVMQQTPDRTPRIHNKNSHASPTPILAGNRIFVHFGYQGTACLTRKGEVVWTNRDLYFKPTHGNGGSPIFVDGLLIFTCDGGRDPKIVALDAVDGQLVWETRRPVSARKTFSFCTPTLIEVNGEKQVVAPGSDCVLALAPKTGDVIWDVRYEGYSVVPKPVYHHGFVYISTGFDSSKLWAIRPTGKGVVSVSHVAWRQ